MAQSLIANFTKTYSEGPSIQAKLELPLDHFSLTVLFGTSGCGKTTLLRCLAGLERPESGHIEAAGMRWFDALTQQCLPTHQRKVGFVFQQASLFPHLNVSENIAFGLLDLNRATRHQRIQDFVALVGLEGLEQRMPAELSGGQQQRVALARALAPHPKVLFLDEPFISLDRMTKEGLRKDIRNLLKILNIPIILVTHDREEAHSLGDRIWLMEEGCIVKNGPPTEVFS